MESLEARWKNLKLLAEEDSEIYVGEENILEEIKVQKPTQPFQIKDINSNTFILSFECLGNLQRIMLRQPWLFDSYLFSLKLFDGLTPPSRMSFSRESFWIQMHDLPIWCMNEKIETNIGKSISVVQQCDVQKDGSGWENALRVCIELDLPKPITRGRTLNLQGHKVLLTYEKLSKLCFRDGRIVHGKGYCEEETMTLNKLNDQFEP